MTKSKLKRGDRIIVISGSQKGHIGTIEKIAGMRAIISGSKTVKRHWKHPQGEKGTIIERAVPIQLSNLALESKKS